VSEKKTKEKARASATKDKTIQKNTRASQTEETTKTWLGWRRLEEGGQEGNENSELRKGVLMSRPSRGGLGHKGVKGLLGEKKRNRGESFLKCGFSSDYRVSMDSELVGRGGLKVKKKTPIALLKVYADN